MDVLIKDKEKIMKMNIVRVWFITILMVCAVIFVNNSYAGTVSAKVIAEQTCIKRMLNGDDNIKILRFIDPDNPFIAIFVTTIKSGRFMAMADPSNTSIAVRLVKPIPIENGKRVIDTRNKSIIASLPKSILSKEMRIGRYYDKEMDTLCYLAYTTKMLDGSLKHSLSVVPLGMPLTK